MTCCVFSETYSCPETHSKCENHKCIPNEAVCDFNDDCGDNSEETNCGMYHHVIKSNIEDDDTYV